MSFYPEDDFLVSGALSRRVFAWLIDIALTAIFTTVLWVILLLFGFATLGFGFGAMSILPFVPFLYNFLSLLSAASATPGQQIMGLTVRRDYDLGPPTALQAVLWTIGFYITMIPPFGVLLIVALFTIRKRALHDIVSGLVVVRVQAMQTLTAPATGWNMPGGSTAP
jgi:uncharacterized RDD family membrane protein YckC